MALTKVGGGIIQQPIDVGIITATSVNASGVITATSFDGNVTGDVTGNLTGTASTASASSTAYSLTGSPNITVGSVTATTGNFSGNLDVGGVLTYEDVTNIDSVGVITARDGLIVAGVSTFNAYVDINGDINIDGSQITYTSSSNQLKFADDAQLRFGGGNDLRIYHTANNSYIDDAGDGDLYVRSNRVRIGKYTGEDAAKFNADGAVELFYDDTKKFETTGIGVSVSGSIEITQEYPSIRPTLDLNFAATKTLDRRITFTRDSVGTYVDDMGIIKYAPNNVPRFDHDPATGESLGLLIEESRTNIQTNSNAPYSSGGTEIVWTTGLTAPDGTSTAVKRAATAVDTHHYSSANIYPGASFPNGTYTHSVYAKRDGLNRFSFKGANLTSVTFDLSTGTVVTGAGGTITPAGNGWYRCSVTESTTNNFYQHSIVLNADNESGYDGFLGDGTSGIIFWGFQMEAGSFPTSYIPTYGSTVTRAVDTAIIRGTNFTDWYNSSASTLFMEGKLSSAISSSQYPFVAFEVESNNNRNNSFAITRRSGQGVRALSYDSSGTQDLDITSGTSWDGGTFRKFAFALDNSGSSSVLVDDGTVIGTDSSYATTSLSSVDILRFANHNSGGMTNFNITIKSFKYYNKRLPNAQLQGLTAQ